MLHDHPDEDLKKRLRIAFRVDASTRMGIGHLKRCLALANSMRLHGVDVIFVMRPLGIDTRSIVAAEGFLHVALSSVDHAGYAPSDDAPSHAAWAEVSQELDADQTCTAVAQSDWVVVDHYAFDRRWHERVAARLGARICVIDDLADRRHFAQVVVDHNWTLDPRSRYASLIPPGARLLAGPRFALLGPSYASAAPYVFQPAVRSIGIFMGGTDAMRASFLAVRACREVAAFRGEIEVVTTSANPHLADLEELCNRWPSTLLSVNLADLSGFFSRHDLQIGAGGGATWERARLGVPTLALKCAENQAVVIDALDALGIIRTVPNASVESVGAAVEQLSGDVEGRRALSTRSRKLVDGRGTQRVTLALLARDMVLRAATAADVELILGWRNDPGTRRYFRDPAEVPRSAHLEWWSRSLRNPERLLMIACCGEAAVGSLRLDRLGASAEISIFLDPDLTGIGLGVELLRAAQSLAASHAWRLDRLTAEIQPDNKASAGAFAAAGFRRTDEINWLWDARSR